MFKAGDILTISAATSKTLDDCKDYYQNVYRKCLKEGVFDQDNVESSTASQLRAQFRAIRETLSLVYGRDNFEKVEQEWARDIIKESYAASNVRILGKTSHSAPTIIPKQDPKIGVHPDKQETAVHHCR